MKKINLNLYKTCIFDCDGVILNSNQIKSNAFYLSTLKYGKEIANELLEYHKKIGGVSRYKKYEFLKHDILPKYNIKIDNNEKESLINLYSQIVSEELLQCELVKGLFELRKELINSNWIVVSGGDQNELRKVFKYMKIDHLDYNSRKIIIKQYRVVLDDTF